MRVRFGGHNMFCAILPDPSIHSVPSAKSRRVGSLLDPFQKEEEAWVLLKLLNNSVNSKLHVLVQYIKNGCNKLTIFDTRTPCTLQFWNVGTLQTIPYYKKICVALCCSHRYPKNVRDITFAQLHRSCHHVARRKKNTAEHFLTMAYECAYGYT